MSELDYGRHEILHMTSFLMNAVQEELLENEAIDTKTEWIVLATQARDALAALYQSIGLEHFSGTPKEQTPDSNPNRLSE